MKKGRLKFKMDKKSHQYRQLLSPKRQLGSSKIRLDSEYDKKSYNPNITSGQMFLQNVIRC